MFKKFVFFIVGIIVLLIMAGFVRTYMVQNGSEQKLFLSGKVPSDLPNGFYKGSANIYTGSWRGKKFDHDAETGVNIFRNDFGIEEERYPFRTYIDKGLQDKDLQVIKLDYNVSKNPYYLRWVLDEIVEVGDNKYLGKVHLRIIPGFPFTLGYFTLQKED